MVPPVTTTQTATTRTTTVTATTHTVYEISFRNVSRDINAAIARISDNEADIATLQTAQGNSQSSLTQAWSVITELSNAQRAAVLQLSAVTGAITNAVGALPMGSVVFTLIRVDTSLSLISDMCLFCTGSEIPCV